MTHQESPSRAIKDPRKLLPLPKSNVLQIADTLETNLDPIRLRLIAEEHGQSVTKLGASALDFKGIVRILAPGCQISAAGRRKLEGFALQDDAVGIAAQKLLQHVEVVREKLNCLKKLGASDGSLFRKFEKAAKPYRLAARGLGSAIVAREPTIGALTTAQKRAFVKECEMNMGPIFSSKAKCLIHDPRYAKLTRDTFWNEVMDAVVADSDALINLPSPMIG